MERPRGTKAAPRKKRRCSPLPGAAAAARSRAGCALRPCRRRLFGGAGPAAPLHSSLKGKCSLKTLPKIKEKLEVTQASHSSNQSTQLNVQEVTIVEETEEQMGESAVLLKESSVINFESKESLKNAEVTSSTGLTLPTGVSTFLIECLDVDSTADYNTGSNDSVNVCSSPEIFRDEDGWSDRSNLCLEDFIKYKNSTLLDSSKAITIDKMPQISNLSAILEPMQEDFRDQYTRRNKPSKCNYSSSELNISTTLAGKKICKITAARERTPDLKTDLHCSSLPDNQATKAKKLKCKKRAEFSRPLEDASSFRQLESAPENTSARSMELTAQVSPSKKPDAVQMSSTMLIMENNKALIKIPGYAQPAELDPICNRGEICSIVRTSPGHRSSRLSKMPLNRSAICFPKRMPEDTITSTRNWVYSKHR
ncbi:meiosis-specific kinetochore protein [Nothoprocta perdicaria]|uniref:meiosis-specific kinetochore protein n=1 Tax=Nothoprocta perdicaria TaxID=30464 RepID=UPI000E1BA3D5|nr:meiosis-specific kinetochore protein [Nothoprocta perdicaria]